LFDTAALVGHLVPAGSVYAFLAGHRREVFPDGLFADLFPSGRGRPSVPAEVIASVLVLQTLQDLSDAEAMDALRCDIRWKVACGLPIDHPGFHPTTLTVWRNRLRGSARPQRIFEAVRGVVAQTGVLTGTTRRALDSVVLDDAVATQDTVTQLIAAVRRVRRAVPAAADLIAQRCVRWPRRPSPHRCSRSSTCHSMCPPWGSPRRSSPSSCLWCSPSRSASCSAGSTTGRAA
jgi:hypothetical protein